MSFAASQSPMILIAFSYNKLCITTIDGLHIRCISLHGESMKHTFFRMQCRKTCNDSKITSILKIISIHPLIILHTYPLTFTTSLITPNPIHLPNSIYVYLFTYQHRLSFYSKYAYTTAVVISGIQISMI